MMCLKDPTELMYPLNIEKELEGAIRSMRNTLSSFWSFMITITMSFLSRHSDC